ncbi:MAG: hypothetical protein WBW94_04530 [Anaerolineales bacterium]
MDNNTLNVIIGTLSGFIIAFLAEPVKIYFQNRSRKENIQSAIYGEMFHNYVTLKSFVAETNTAEDIEKFTKFFKYSVRTECYKFALSQETALFYQLTESTPINGMYAFLLGVLDFSTEEKNKKQFDPEQLASQYLEAFSSAVEIRIIKKNILQKSIGKKTFQVFFKS